METDRNVCRYLLFFFFLSSVVCREMAVRSCVGRLYDMARNVCRLLFAIVVVHQEHIVAQTAHSQPYRSLCCVQLSIKLLSHCVCCRQFSLGHAHITWDAFFHSLHRHIRIGHHHRTERTCHWKSLSETHADPNASRNTHTYTRARAYFAEQKARYKKKPNRQ